MAPGALNFAETVAVLRGGGVLVLPTDTLPGLHCRADNQKSALKVAGMKGRDDGKPLLVLAASLDQARAYCGTLRDDQERICRECWPGPFSLILPAGVSTSRSSSAIQPSASLPSASLPSASLQPASLQPAERVTAGGGTVAVRVPRFPELQRLMDTVGCPLISTSANLQGDAPAMTCRDAFMLFEHGVQGYWVPENCHPGGIDDGGRMASALVDLTGNVPNILRPGPESGPF